MFDLSSSWVEGSKCELAEFGYSRDGKRGRRQIEYGLLTDRPGRPSSSCGPRPRNPRAAQQPRSNVLTITSISSMCERCPGRPCAAQIARFGHKPGDHSRG